ncbi:MAG TPA: LLM class oxidoreductase [Kofleriaceae bacterium]|jgi:luciferase-type oxidoreductase|nr:LLM class oxidoreductase [Kofleriaceae bacterium]
MASRDEHPGWRRLFVPGRLTLGLFFPIEAYLGDTPTMRDQERLARRAEELGFAALWVRDVPLRDPSFGDVGQIYDPWVWLGHIAGLTREVALVTGAIVLPLRHPLHVAKAAASVDRLSDGRFILGVATGDRPSELGAFGVDVADRGAAFRRHLEAVRGAWGDPPAPPDHLELVPRPPYGDTPILVTGRSQQTLGWIAANADGWVTYPRPPAQQAAVLAEWRAATRAVGAGDKPFAQSLYIDLASDPQASPRRIHLGWELGREPLVQLLETYARLGIGHVVLNLKYGHRSAHDVVEELGDHVLPRLGPVAEHRDDEPAPR